MATYTVKFASEEHGTVLDVNSEPQFVKVRSNNNYYVVLDSEDMYLDVEKQEIVFSGANTPNSYPYPMVMRTKRFTVSSMFVTCKFLNITPRNNAIEFVYDAGPPVSYAVIPQGIYATPLTILNAIVAAMNAAIPGAFSSTSFAQSPDEFEIKTTNPARSFRFIDTCTAITRGKTVYNLPRNTVLANTHRIGPIYGIYPRKIQVCSRALMQYTKMHNHATNNRANLLVPIIHNAQGPLENPFIQFNETAWINFDENANLAQIDIQLLDEFNEPVYVPPDAVSGRQHLYYVINLLCEM
jgi:hypothetical protein